MEISTVTDAKTEEILKEANSIYGFENSKEILYNYANYIDMKKNKEVNFGNYNILIRNNSAYDSADKVVSLITKLLKEKCIIKAKYKYLEENDIVDIVKEKKDIKEKKGLKDLKEELLIIDTKKKDISMRYVKKYLKQLIQKFPQKVFILIDEDEIEGSTNCDFGNLISWTMEIEKISNENKIDYIKKYFKKNKIKLHKNNTFVEKLAEEPFWKVKNEIINIITKCKIKKINMVTDEIIEKDLNLKYTRKNINKFISKSSKDAIKGLDALVGVEDIKKQVNKIMNYIDVNKERKNMPMLHMCFEGNPGTGKTTVARIIGEIFKQKNILSDKGNFIEVQRSDLIAKYVGWTAKQTKEWINKAKGGILFIDEAYSLSPKYGSDFANECIATLIKEMEDQRENLCVIMAGYTDEMEELLEANPGFQSRIQFKVKFPDYEEEDLYSIFKQMCKSEGYKVSSNIKGTLLKYFSEEKQKTNFSNGRCVRNIFEKVKFEQADRVTKESNPDINLITKKDIESVLDTMQTGKKPKIKLGFAC